MSALIDAFQASLAAGFRELVLATAYLEIGHRATMQSPPTAAVSLILADGISTEPMFLHELQPHRGAVVFGIAELFQTRAIASWSDLLNDLFAKFVEEHIAGVRNIPAFKKRSTRLDFASSANVLDQIREGLVSDFAFSKYADRIQTIGRVLSLSAHSAAELQIVRKHVFIRNATQHHGSKVYEDMLRELGANSISVLNGAGATINLIENQHIALFVPELDRLKSALFIITNEWRGQLGTNPNGGNP